MPSKQTAADIVVIGAGIHGASVAYNLATRLSGAEIVVLDRAERGGGATAASAAMLMHQTDDESITRLARLSIERYRELANTLRVDIGLHQTGSILFSTSDKGGKRLVALAEFQRSLGVETDVIDGSEVEVLTGGVVSGDGIAAATYCPSDGYVAARAVVDGYLDFAERRGATVRPNTAAVELMLDNQQVVGVKLDSGEVIDTDCVVNCAGARAREVGLWAGIDLPIKRSHRNMLLLKVDEPGRRRVPIVEDVDSGWYFRRHPDGVLMGVGPTNWLDEDQASLDATYDSQYEAVAAEYLEARAPSLAPLATVETWAGSRPMLDPVVVRHREGADGHPIVGGVAGTTGLYLSCAWGAFGVTLAPIGGELAAQAVCGEKPTVDTAPLSWARFSAKQRLRLDEAA